MKWELDCGKPKHKN